MADMNDLADLMKSVDASTKEQTGILRSILDHQLKESLRAEERFRLSRVDRDVEPIPPPSPGPTPPGQPTPGGDSETNNTLAGLLGGLTALFGRDILGRFSLLAVGAAGLAASVALTIGVVKGQMIAIETFFKAFTPGLVRIFDDFKVNLSGRFAAISVAFTDLVDDLRIRAAFIRVSVAEIFDNFVNTIRTTFSSGQGSRFSGVITAIRTSLDTLIEPFRVALTTIQELAGPSGPPGRIAGIFSSISGWFKELASMLGRIATVVGRIFAPIAIIMTAFETIRGALDGYAEGGLFGALRGGIDGFFTSLFTVPLDLVKNLVAWIADKFGFDETAEVLREFSFTDLFRQMTASIFAGVESAFNAIVELFTFTEEDMSLLGALGKLTDIVYAPVNMAIDFVRGLFGFEETDEAFRLQDWIAEQFNKIIDSVKEMFAFIPSVDELKTLMFNALPEWLQELIGGETVRGSLPQQNYVNPVDEFTGFTGATGSRGFVDFGSGTRAMLHGLEAVVPRSTDAGQFLANNFDDNWRLKLSSLERNGQENARPIVINAPNNSQTNVNTTGGTSSTILNAFGGSRSDLDYLSIPGGAQ
jgi:hypothetical protein